MYARYLRMGGNSENALDKKIETLFLCSILLIKEICTRSIAREYIACKCSK